EHHHLASVVEERGVLITVRLQLNRSAAGPRLYKEREDDRLAPQRRQRHGLAEDSVAGDPSEREVGSHLTDFWTFFGLLLCLGLLSLRRTRAKQHQSRGNR